MRGFTLFAAALLQALLVQGTHVCPFDDTFFYTVDVLSIASGETMGHATLRTHQGHVNVELFSAADYEFVHFKSVIVPNKSSLPVTRNKVVNLQMFSHHQIFYTGDTVSTMCTAEDTTCCTDAVPVGSFYIAGTRSTTPGQWVYGVLDGVAVNGVDRSGGTFVYLHGLCV